MAFFFHDLPPNIGATVIEQNHKINSIDAAMKITLRTKVVQKCSIDSFLISAMIKLTSIVVKSSGGVIVSATMDNSNRSKKRFPMTDLCHFAFLF